MCEEYTQQRENIRNYIVTEEQPQKAEIPAKARNVYCRLRGFPRDLLHVIAGMDAPHGQAIKDELKEYYETEIYPGRLYSNLDTLVEEDLIERGEKDGRTNWYRMTEWGETVLEAHFEMVRATTHVTEQNSRCIQADDLTVGMIVENKYGKRIQVTALETPDNCSAEYVDIGQEEFGYAPPEWEPETDHDTGICGIAAGWTVERIISDGERDD